MAVYTGEIDTYFLNIMSSTNHHGPRLMNVHGAFGAAILWFIPGGSPLPANVKRQGQDVFDVHFQMDAWPAVLDVLRNEKPVFFHFDDTRNSAQIHTGREPVGEGEG